MSHGLLPYTASESAALSDRLAPKQHSKQPRKKPPPGNPRRTRWTYSQPPARRQFAMFFFLALFSLHDTHVPPPPALALDGMDLEGVLSEISGMREPEKCCF